ncbi:MAG: murein biosynthesis integral membrane protein MurJ [bacterium]|nr:murein biosynthesis integral membrane protein MurJ [bacterium]
MKISRTIGFSAGLLATSSIASYALGLIRDRLLAGKFGAGAELDVFSASFIIPDAIMSVFAAALTTAFVPVFTSWWHKQGEKATWELTNRILYLIGLLIITATVIAWLLMPWLAQLVAPGFDETRHDLLTSTTRLMLFSPLFFSVSVLFGSALQGLRRFISYALSPVLYNFGIVFGIVFLTPRYGITGAIMGVVIGAALHMIIRIIELWQAGWLWERFSITKPWPWQHPGIKKTVKLMLPRIVGLLTWQANLWMFTAIASGLAVGSVAIFNMARNFQSLPVSLFGIALATALFPAISIHYAKGNIDKFRDDIVKAIKQVLFFTIPAGAGLALIAKPLIDAFLGTGKFSNVAVVATGMTLTIFSLSIPLESLQHIFARTFYAQHDTITPVKVTIFATIINVIVSFTAVKFLGVSGLAMGFVAFALTQVIVLGWLLRKRIKTINEKVIIKSIGKTILATGFMIIAILTIQSYLEHSLTILIASVSIGGLVFIMASLILRNEELISSFGLVKKIIKLQK